MATLATAGIFFVPGLIPWVLAFLACWKRSIYGCGLLDRVFGESKNPQYLKEKNKYFLFLGFLIAWCLLCTIMGYMGVQLGIVPRSIYGFLNIHQAVFMHAGFAHFGSNMGAVVTLGPLVMGYNRRTFVSSIFFIGLLEGIIYWIVGPGNVQVVGLSGVLFGWFGFLTIALVLECPPVWWRVILLLLAGYFLGQSFYLEILSGDDQEGVSYWGHVLGFIVGLLFGYLKFRRNWFEFASFEDEVRPLGTSPGICFCLKQCCALLFRPSAPCGQGVMPESMQFMAQSWRIPDSGPRPEAAGDATAASARLASAPVGASMDSV
eukprot:TRINITY_DN23452_c0_g1_i1.p1 TRINITY_DN23452_c0_g1~~TRINITY_DN23452_c0_g1_i1.p1  ORF type:complete len:320 (+),score=40.07 TRINITY_DN23452_c0_g1_i1:109-1068(+)